MKSGRLPFPCGRLDPPPLTRREALKRGSLGFGSLALAWLLGDEGRLSAADGKPVLPSRSGRRARGIILLHMGGAPSHVDTWDPKPSLAKLAGQPVPESIAKRVPTNRRLRVQNLYPTPFAFRRYGQSGIEVSDLFRETARHADDICVIRSLHHSSPIHTPAEYLTLTGSLTGSRPTLGAWLYYGLGSENRNLPGYIVMDAGENFSGAAIWQSGFLPAKYQGTLVKAAEGIPHVQLPAGYTDRSRRAQLDLVTAMNRRHLERHGADSELESRIESYELAFRMQAAAPEAFDLSGESEATKRFYGIDDKETTQYGTNCLLARRLIERGVRVIQLNQGGWDAHGDLKGNHEKQARLVDKPIAGLLSDLKARGLLEETLVVWGGEFGRTPTVEGDAKKPGRDHSPAGYTMWLAGGGVKGGQIIGATDEVGYTVVERPISPTDVHATLLHGLGFEQHEIYFEHQGRKELVTFNGGDVIAEVFV